MRKYLFCAIFITSFVQASEEQLKMEDYAKGIELITETRSPIYQLLLPEQVYRNITRTDLNDIRIFNHAHEQVPHIIRQQKDNTESISETLEVPFFPLPFNEDTLLENNLDVTVTSEGKVVRVQTTSDVEEQNNIAKYYLIDVSHIDYSIDSIDFKIGGNNKGYAKNIKLESSNDLNNWSPLVRNASLTELEYGNYTLNKKRVEMPNKKIKYIRFSWLDDAEELFIDSIKANFSKNNIRSNKKIWANAKLKNHDVEQNTYEFDVGGIFNIEQINVELPEDNTLIDVIIQSRQNKDSKWSYQYQGVFYKLNVNDTEVTREPVNINLSKHRYWRVKLLSTDGIGKLEPNFRFSWRANELYFLARGEGPFLLAYGNAHASISDQKSSKLLKILDKNNRGEMIETAFTGQEIILKGDSALKIEKELPWQRILLWLVLIIGVLVIAIMAFRLIKQMEIDNP